MGTSVLCHVMPISSSAEHSLPFYWWKVLCWGLRCCVVKRWECPSGRWSATNCWNEKCSSQQLNNGRMFFAAQDHKCQYWIFSCKLLWWRRNLVKPYLDSKSTFSDVQKYFNPLKMSETWEKVYFSNKCGPKVKIIWLLLSVLQSYIYPGTFHMVPFLTRLLLCAEMIHHDLCDLLVPPHHCLGLPLTGNQFVLRPLGYNQSPTSIGAEPYYIWICELSSKWRIKILRTNRFPIKLVINTQVINDDLVLLFSFEHGQVDRVLQVT